MIGRIVLTAIVVIMCGAILSGSAVAAGRAQAELQVRKGLSEPEARRRAMTQALITALVVVAFGIAALVYIW
jgi:hypothetical protein